MASYIKYFTLKNDALLRTFEGEENFELRKGAINPGRCPVEGEPVYMMIELESWDEAPDPRELLYKAIAPWCDPNYNHRSNWTFVAHESFAIRRFASMVGVHHFLVKNLFLLIDPDSNDDFKTTPVFMHSEQTVWALVRFWPKKIYPILDHNSSSQLQDIAIGLALSIDDNINPILEDSNLHYIERMTNQGWLFGQVKDIWYDDDPCDYRVAAAYYEAVTKNTINGIAL
jgi:hypothetical protein